MVRRLEYADAADWLGTRAGEIFALRGPAEQAITTAGVAGTVPGTIERLVGTGFPVRAAGTYVSGWLPAAPAYVVATMYAETGAGLLLADSSLRWWLNPEGWTEGLDVVGPVAVEAGHRWENQPGVTVLPAATAVAERCVASLIAEVTPIVDRIQQVSGAGRVGLWHEVSDAMGAALIERETPPSTMQVQRLRDLVSVPGRPWKRLPRIELIEAAGERICVSHRGGCCQSFTMSGAAAAEAHAEAPDDDDPHAAFARAFPREQGEPDYCASCKFRDFPDVVRRRLWWRNQESAQ